MVDGQDDLFLNLLCEIRDELREIRRSCARIVPASAPWSENWRASTKTWGRCMLSSGVGSTPSTIASTESSDA